MNDAIVASNLRKRFISYERIGFIRRRKIVVEALRGVSFRVRWGEVYGLLGPNGAGKTTTVKILATLLIPDDGYAMIDGHDVVKEAGIVRGIIGLVLYPDKGFYSRLSGYENLVYFGRLYGLSKSVAEARARELMNLVGLENAMNRPYEEYSLGMRARLAIARALIHDPPVLFLDEPTIGLDPISAREVRELVRRLRKEGKAVLFTSHNLWEVEEVCDRVGIINNGRMIIEGSPRDIKDMLGLKYVIEVEVQLNGRVETIREETTNPADALRRVINDVEARGLRISRIRINEPSLEEAFIRVIGDENG
ncbi:ABC transporter ATP-binding protein [Vulcanisaeta distributa]|uniref:ABC transporter related protein n=1 Tax=Vulcanisaeta distributa (strain DSM 14429 / JCM 11212 / NBRC 100878 / IC-017) TaxID=572478 RepID=E1QQQ5_VULDI|nr:ABC transporter ATP-binding protein [Vulcanisaeta distributa]ADN51667.1 ABC transporter related protein [Vulcanisaeta distributa DSM 14429]